MDTKIANHFDGNNTDTHTDDDNDYQIDTNNEDPDEDNKNKSLATDNSNSNKERSATDGPPIDSRDSGSSSSIDQQMNKTLTFGKKRLFGRSKTITTAPAADDKLNGDVATVSGGGGGGGGHKSGTSRKKSQSSALANHKWPAVASSNSSGQLSSSAASTPTSGGQSSAKSNGVNSLAATGGDQSDDRFIDEGVQFVAKLIGHEFVAEARGEQMCQQSLKKLKILQRGLGGHKRKTHLFISFDGIKIRDAQSSELLYHHSVPQISFISRDETDSRAFGYVFGSSSTGHQFIAFKTQKEAMPIMSTIGQLFAATLKRKRAEILTNQSTNVTNSIAAVNSSPISLQTIGSTASVVTETNSHIAIGAINEDKSLSSSSTITTPRRESSVTLRPSRSESPNVPTIPAPPPPTTTTSLHHNRSSYASATGAASSSSTTHTGSVVNEELDLFANFEPHDDSVFESDWNMKRDNIEKLTIDNMTTTIEADPFVSSFGSQSVSSDGWANFDDDNTSTSTASPQQQHHNSNNNNTNNTNRNNADFGSKPFVIQLKTKSNNNFIAQKPRHHHHHQQQQQNQQQLQIQQQNLQQQQQQQQQLQQPLHITTPTVSSSFGNTSSSSSSVALNSPFGTSGRDSQHLLNKSTSQLNQQQQPSPAISTSSSELTSTPAAAPVTPNNTNTTPLSGYMQHLASTIATNPSTNGSNNSSADRYACFAEIHSISNSIFDSLVDNHHNGTTDSSSQSDFNASSTSNSSLQSKSYHSSLNSSFGSSGQEYQPQHRQQQQQYHHLQQQQQQHQQQSHTGSGHPFYFSFDNPLNSEQQRQNFLFSQQDNSRYNNQSVFNDSTVQPIIVSNNSNRNSQQFDQTFGQMSKQNNNNSNNLNDLFNNTNNWAQSFNGTRDSSTIWSNTSSSVSTSSQVSGTSSPAPPNIAAPTPPPSTLSDSISDINQSTDRLNDMFSMFADLDPLGKDRPFLDKSLFFSDQKQRPPTLRDLNGDIVVTNTNNTNSFGGSTVPTVYGPISVIADQTSNVSSVTTFPSTARPHSSAANPFSSTSSLESTNSSRFSPNPFNPFNINNATCALNTSQTPPPPPLPLTAPPSALTPPPPRPPSRDCCPPVPPRSDLMRQTPPQPPPKAPTPDLAPPLPRRRTILPDNSTAMHRYQSFDTMSRQSAFDPFSANILPNNNNTFSYATNSANIMSDSSAPPLPNPQRKVPTNPMPLQQQQPPPPASSPPVVTNSAGVVRPQPMARKLSAKNYDPFNCSFVDSHLSSSISSVPAINTNRSVVLSSESQQTTTNFGVFSPNNTLTSDTPHDSCQSTPKLLSDTVPNIRQQDLKLSEINSKYEWINETVDLSSVTTETETTPSTDSADKRFVADFSSVFSSPDGFADNNKPMVSKPSTLDLDFESNFDTPLPQQSMSTSAALEDHISPPDRNIFIIKSDPFADDFFNS
ncbi:formin-J-like [Oppia nitens]|uniref:formin-J-like n=1 Tax=Oppia nitens TaxID=1686743 RepID=UPI0023D9CB7D|nr:formin-J-like [Oppia nitens]